MIDEKRLDGMSVQVETGNYIDCGFINRSELQELIRLARLGLWAEQHGVPALAHMVIDIKQLDGTCPHATFVDGERALAALPKECEK